MSPGRRFTETQVVYIRECVARGVSKAELAIHYDVSPSTISQIARGNTYKEAGGPLQKGHRSGPRLQITDVQITELLDRRANGDKYVDLAAQFNISTSAVCRLVTGRTYRARNASRNVPSFHFCCPKCGEQMRQAANLCGLCELDELEARTEALDRSSVCR